MEPITAIVGFLGTIGGAGVVWGTTTQRLRATEHALSDVKKEVSAHKLKTDSIDTRLAHIEGKLDLLLERR